MHYFSSFYSRCPMGLGLESPWARITYQEDKEGIMAKV